jgi:hypothetical protein
MTATATTTPTRPAVSPRPGKDPADHLVTGWEAHREVGDSLLRRFVHAYASSFVAHVTRMDGHAIRRDHHVAWGLDEGSWLFNGAMLLQPLPHDGWEPLVAGLQRDLSAVGHGRLTLFSPWPTPDLTSRGWHLAGHPPLLVAPSGGPAPPSPDWLEVVRVTDASTLADWERVVVEGYPLPSHQPCRPGTIADARVLDDANLHAWVGYVDGEAAAIGTSYVAHGVDVFTLGVTMPAHRGRGAWQVMARQRLAAAPHLPAMGLFSDLSRGPAEGLGFLPVHRWTVWSRDRPR